MKKLTLVDLQALRGAGGTITIKGQPVPAVEVPAPVQAVAQPAPALVSEADVHRMVAESDAVWRELVDSLQRQIDLLTAQVQLQSHRSATPWRMKATYLADGSIDELVAMPAPGVH